MIFHYDPTTERWTIKHNTHPSMQEQKRRMNSLRNCARMPAREIQSSNPAGVGWGVPIL